MLILYYRDPTKAFVSLQGPEFLSVIIPAAVVAIFIMIFLKKKNAMNKLKKYYKELALKDYDQLLKLLQSQQKFPCQKFGRHLPGLGGIIKMVFIEESAERNQMNLEDYIRNVVPLLEEIIKVGTYAPTGKGAQSPIIIAVTNKEIRDELSKQNALVLGNPSIDPFYGAPVVLIVLADKQYGTYLYDGSCVMDNLLNAAQAEGVSSIWIHRAKQVMDSEYGKALLKSLNITSEYEGIGFCCLGYCDGELPIQAKPRKENYVYFIK